MPRFCQYKDCDQRCYGEFCLRHKPRKELKRTPLKKSTKPIAKRGSRTIDYEKWRDTVAIPYLDKTFGRDCANCGASPDYDEETGIQRRFAVDHIIKRSLSAKDKMSLDNVQYLCPPCHNEKDNGILRSAYHI